MEKSPNSTVLLCLCHIFDDMGIYGVLLLTKTLMCAIIMYTPNWEAEENYENQNNFNTKESVD